MHIYESRRGKTRVTACITTLKKGTYYEVHRQDGNVIYMRNDIFNRLYVRAVG
ncbi:hypothetical protein [Oribacterium sp. WCC10]|uniref:hypothetical protein n=1 Tax=Oribacterium sp. WCC10 TaxID=1855343 RepID=UPI0008DF6C31|nr:hypothetical protein [Oribacterium sp. WCC10]SFG79512.1 hypothetical protein SAMN05216356_1304 [Oribacterium sp. WCC10]